MRGSIDSKHRSASLFSTLVYCLTTLHLSFKINATEKTWKEPQAFFKVLMNYNIHKELLTPSIVQLNKYLQTENMCISNVKVEDQTQTPGALLSITPQSKGKHFTNFSQNTTFCCNPTLHKWNHTLCIIFYLTYSAQIPLAKFLHIVAIVKDFNKRFFVKIGSWYRKKLN